MEGEKITGDDEKNTQDFVLDTGSYFPMPDAKANKDWNQKESPYVTVAHIRLSKQEAYSEARQQYIEGFLFRPLIASKLSVR